jgi:hypothetical protein
MRAQSVIAAFIAVAAASTVSLLGQKPEGGIPGSKKGDKVLIRGCVSWPLFIETQRAKVDITGEAATGLTYRLTGDKNLVKPLQKEHDHTVVDIAGIVKSPGTNTGVVHTKDLGRTKVYAGIIDAAPRAPEEHDEPAVIRVTGFEPSGSKCRM